VGALSPTLKKTEMFHSSDASPKEWGPEKERLQPEIAGNSGRISNPTVDARKTEKLLDEREKHVKTRSEEKTTRRCKLSCGDIIQKTRVGRSRNRAREKGKRRINRN